jgi:peptide/nickel transport system permease protein
MSSRNNQISLRIGMVLVIAFIALALLGHFIAPYGFDQVRAASGLFGNLVAPNEVNILGTTSSGFDVFSRLVLGASTGLVVMCLSILIAATLGIVLGLTAGFFGGFIDRLLSLIADALFAIPALLIALVLSFTLSAGSSTTYSAITAAVVAEGLTFSARYFRIVRAEVRVVLDSRYVEAARVSGISSYRLMFRHVLPNSLQTAPVLITQNGSDAILTLAGLGFLGVGISGNQGAEWGYDLSQSLSDISSGIWWTGTFTALVVALTVIGLTLLGEGLADKKTARSAIG